MLIFFLILPIIKQIIQTIKLTNTIDEPIGKFEIMHEAKSPIIKEITLDAAAKIVTPLNVLNTCLADNVGNIIKAVINKAPITFIPITTVNDVKIEIIILINVVFVPVDLENVSSNVTLNILLYRIIYNPTTITATTILNITSVRLTPKRDPYK